MLLAVVAGPLLAACGDNINPGGDDIDAGDDDPIDAETDADESIDADLSPTHSATIAVFDSALTDPLTGPLAGLVSIRGGTIRMSFSDLTQDGGLELFRQNNGAPINGCLITQFDPTHLPNPRLDASPVTISAPETGASALLKTVGPCTLLSPFGDPDPYVCISHSASATVTAQDIGSPAELVAYVFPPGPTFGNAAIVSAVRAADVTTITTAVPHGFAVGDLVTITGVTPTTFNVTGVAIVAAPSTSSFTYANAGTAETATADPVGDRARVPTRVPGLIGAALVVNGFADLRFNSGASAFPVIVHNPADPNILVARNTTPGAGDLAANQAGVAYQVLNGFTPVPTFGTPGHDFLGGSPSPGAPGSIRIQKAADPDWPAIDFTVDIPGQARVPVALTSAVRATNVVTATTTAAHDFIVGQVITVAGITDAAVSLTTATRLSNVVTVTSVAAHGFTDGQTITVAGVTPSTFNGGPFTVANATANTFTYAQTAADDATGTLGTATLTSFNGTGFIILSTPSTTTFTYAQTGSNRSVTGGTAVKPGGFALDAGSNLPHVFPTVAAALNYSCDNDTTSPTPNFAADDTCGDESSTPLKAMIVSGSASRKSVGSLLPFQMPTEVPGTDTWLEWQCAFLVSKSADMPIEAVTAILGFQPTRIEQQVLFVAGQQMAGPGTTNATSGRILAGHALAGHTTMCPAAGAPPPPATITTAVRAGNEVTVTTSAPHNFFPGQAVTLAGVTDTSFNTTTGVITSTLTVNGAVVQFRFGQAGADASTTGGTASVLVAQSGAGGPVCAACNDGVDNDSDGLIDLLDTTGCASAADTSELP